MKGKYTTEFAPSARNQLRAIDRRRAMAILRKLTELETDPKGFKTTELVSRPGVRRLRVGDYRVLYTVDGGRVVIVVIAVAHRSTVYDE